MTFMYREFQGLVQRNHRLFCRRTQFISVSALKVNMSVTYLCYLRILNKQRLGIDCVFSYETVGRLAVGFIFRNSLKTGAVCECHNLQRPVAAHVTHCLSLGAFAKL